MSGKGDRFIKKGYKLPKPLILVNGKPMIAYIIELFSKDDDFIFICNKTHLSNNEFQMRETLTKYAPNCEIVEIEDHKLGPVHALNQARDYIDDEQPTIVNYCDFTCYWDYSSFKNFITNHESEGLVVSYRGFHPHVLWGDFYGYVKVKGNEIIDYQEKYPFTKEPQNEFTSTGTYYFKKGSILKKYTSMCISKRLLVNKEYYVSMIYKSMLGENKKVLNYEVEHFMQWGTPRDLEEYLYWSRIFRNIKKNESSIPGTIVMPMVGAGKRFSEEGFDLPKPLISVSEQPMFLNAINFLPFTRSKIAIVREDMKSYEDLNKAIKLNDEVMELIVLRSITDGQATTCFEGIKDIPENLPITISSCDNGVLYDHSKLLDIINSLDYDVIVWGARRYPGAIRNSDMYGWIEIKANNEIKSISVKKPTDNPEEDPVIIGTFTFKNKETYISSYKSMKERNGKVNGEYYIDSMINDALNIGKKCIYFEVDSYISWGTPLELKTFNYWQSCFHKWKLHPYRLENDNTMTQDGQKLLNRIINNNSNVFEKTKNLLN